MPQKNNPDNEKLTKNKSRVNDFGEVFTPNKIVNDMVSMIDDNIDVLNSKYLEPACGEGSFLQKILKDKISLVKKKYKKDTKQLLINSLYVYTTLYGIDILQDNILITKRILKEIYEENFSNYIEKYPEYELIKNLKFILNTNIICGDALTLLKNNNEPIIFSEWSLIGNKLKRREFKFSNLISHSPFEEGTLFSDLGEKAFIPVPLKDHAIVNIFEIHND